ncbi:MAG: pyridoxal-phosphate dependent enzyme [Microthrixaceae bacterium]
MNDAAPPDTAPPDTVGTELPTVDDVRAAAERIRDRVHRTPVLRSRSVDEWVGAEVHLKCEHLQRVGAFKARGAANAVALLDDDEAAAGVSAHSSGNHAAALALAARERGVPCWIVMPSNAPATKIAATRAFGAEVVFCEPTLAARESTLADLRARTGAAEVHPYDDPRVIAGAGTAALELLEDVDGLEAVVVPVGGGGLMSGTAVVVDALSPGTEVWAAEPAGADDAARSLAEGRLVPQTAPRTIADGLLTSLAPRTFRALRDLTAGVVTVTEDEIVAAMRLLWERTKQVVEPSGTVALAALGGQRPQGNSFEGRRVGVVLTGGNVDLSTALTLLGGSGSGSR